MNTASHWFCLQEQGSISRVEISEGFAGRWKCFRGERKIKNSMYVPRRYPESDYTWRQTKLITQWTVPYEAVMHYARVIIEILFTSL